MTILTIDKAKYPDGFTATAGSGGTLSYPVTYYYRVAAVTNEGETCACGSANATTSLTNRTIALAWNAVAGVKTTGGYKVYRNTSDTWTSGNLLIKTVDTNSYSDTGSDSPGAGTPVIFTSNNIRAPTQNLPFLAPAINIPGVLGGTVQFLGSAPDELTLEGFVVGSSAITDREKIRDIGSAGLPIYITLAAQSQNWLLDYYLIRVFLWSLRPGTANVSGAEIMDWRLEFYRTG